MGSAIDWKAVRSLMDRAARGAGITPTTAEQRLLESALQADPERYGRESKAARSDARAEVWPGGAW